jgi:gluconolactonase
MSFTEGPVWRAAEQALFFSDFKQSDVTMGRIMRYAPSSGCVAHVMPIASNGLALALDGQLLACRHDDQTVATVDPASGKATTLIADYMGLHFRSPNDVTVRSDGTIYFSDPGWQLGSRTPERPEGFYRRSANGELFAEEMLARANGITLSPDESTLYVSNTAVVRAYDVAADGSLSDGRMFVNKSADGMVVDCTGNLYLTTGGNVEVYSAAGALLGTIDVPGGTTNVAFGGPTRTTLFITGDTKLHAVDLLVPGYPF